MVVKMKFNLMKKVPLRPITAILLAAGLIWMDPLKPGNIKEEKRIERSSKIKKLPIIRKYTIDVTKQLCKEERGVSSLVKTTDSPRDSVIIKSLGGTYYVRPDFIKASMNMRSCGGLQTMGAIAYEQLNENICDNLSSFSLRDDFGVCDLNYVDKAQLLLLNPRIYDMVDRHVKKNLNKTIYNQLKKYFNTSDKWLSDASKAPWVSENTLAQIVAEREKGFFEKDSSKHLSSAKKKVRSELKKNRNSLNQYWKQHIVSRL